MSLTSFDKEKVPADLDTLKSLIDERASFVETKRAEKATFNETIDQEIRDADKELTILRVKAAQILGIPSKLEVPEGKTPTQNQRESGVVEKKDVAKTKEGVE